MARILQAMLVSVLALAWGPLAAEDAGSSKPVASDIPPEGEGGGHGLSGLFIGAVAGVAVGFGVAAASDYPLKEGGGYTVILLGGGLGAFVGHKVGSSAGRPWHDPGRLQASLAYAWTTSAASPPSVPGEPPRAVTASACDRGATMRARSKPRCQ